MSDRYKQAAAIAQWFAQSGINAALYLDDNAVKQKKPHVFVAPDDLELADPARLERALSIGTRKQFFVEGVDYSFHPKVYLLTSRGDSTEMNDKIMRALRTQTVNNGARSNPTITIENMPYPSDNSPNDRMITFDVKNGFEAIATGCAADIAIDHLLPAVLREGRKRQFGISGILDGLTADDANGLIEHEAQTLAEKYDLDAQKITEVVLSRLPGKITELGQQVGRGSAALAAV